MITKDNTIAAILTKPLGSRVEAHGWIKTRRDSKGIHFIQLNDGSSFQDLQVVIESITIPEQATTGACVRVTGERSEERRVGKECRDRRWADTQKRKERTVQTK